MSVDEELAQLHADIDRWRVLLLDAEATYCQGIANKASKEYEVVLKRVVKRRLEATGRSLPSLLGEVEYTGGAQTVDKLPGGTLAQVATRLARYDPVLAEALPSEVRKTLGVIVEVRNEITHELAPDNMRAAVTRLLDLMAQVVGRKELAALL